MSKICDEVSKFHVHNLQKLQKTVAIVTKALFQTSPYRGLKSLTYSA